MNCLSRSSSWATAPVAMHEVSMRPNPGPKCLRLQERSAVRSAVACALGARGALIGKAFLYALAGAGEAGVSKVIEIMRNELRVTLALTGTSNVAAAGPQILRFEHQRLG